MINQKAQVLAFGDGFALLTIGAAVAAALSLLTTPGNAPIPQLAAQGGDDH
jgi:hypothetical protein